MRDPDPVLLDASAAASGGHVVFASSAVRMKLVENSRLARDALVDDESTTLPFTIAQSISSPVAVPLTVFLPSQPISQPFNFPGHLFFACE